MGRVASKYSQAAYAVLTKSLQFECYNIFKPVEEDLNYHSLIGMLGQMQVSDRLREHLK